MARQEQLRPQPEKALSDAEKKEKTLQEKIEERSPIQEHPQEPPSPQRLSLEGFVFELDHLLDKALRAEFPEKHTTRYFVWEEEDAKNNKARIEIRTIDEKSLEPVVLMRATLEEEQGGLRGKQKKYQATVEVFGEEGRKFLGIAQRTLQALEAAGVVVSSPIPEYKISSLVNIETVEDPRRDIERIVSSCMKEGVVFLSEDSIPAVVVERSAVERAFVEEELVSLGATV